MKIQGIDLVQLLGQIRSFIMVIVGFVIAIVLLGTVAKALGHTTQYLPALDPMQMAYLGIGYWASR